MAFHHSITVVYIFWITYDNNNNNNNHNNMGNNAQIISFGRIRLKNHQAVHFGHPNTCCTNVLPRVLPMLGTR